MKKMATSLSTYWVKFFTGAGFPLDVATKHAVVFSNNRIKPDMLPDLDKPSLKEMGITLMGDMIAILRYAKKVSEEMTCERFLVDNIDDHSDNITSIAPPSQSKPHINTKIHQTKLPAMKKVITKLSPVPNKSLMAANSISTMKESLKSSVKQPNTPHIIAKKKSIDNNTRAMGETTKLIGISHEQQARKRKIVEQTEIIDSSESATDEWTNQIQKRLKIPTTNNNNNTYDKQNYKILLPRQQKKQMTNTNARLQSAPLQTVNKKLLEQKRTVFDRLGDSSVTSTTNNLIEPNTTFNITGLGSGSEVLKRNSSVFNRLGDRDVKNDTIQQSTILSRNDNANSGQQPHGILKSKVSNIGSTTTVKLMMNSSNASGKMSTGTMHADHERNDKKKIVSSSVKQLVRNTKAMKLNNNNNNNNNNSNTSLVIGKNVKKIIPSKSVSERAGILPARARLGVSGVQKQVTFNKIATVKHIKKPGVFSRLGV